MNIVHSIAVLQPGLYLMRHPGRGLAPLGFTVAPDSHGTLKTMATNDGILRSGQDCIVAHVVDAPVQVCVIAYLSNAGDEVPALRLDRVRLEEPGMPVQPPRVPETRPSSAQAPREFEVPAHGISLIGHVERSGDVMALPKTILGDPAANLRLEGFQIVWPDRPAGVELTASVVVEGRGALPAVGIGHFCGTRNAAARIVELTLALGGAGAAALKFDGVAFFSGGYEVPLTSGRALAGPSGLEHLTAIKVQVVAAAEGKPKAWEPSSGAREFRGDSRKSGHQR